MAIDTAAQLYKDGIINHETLDGIRQFESGKLFSVHWELRTILYIGILLLTSGVGLLVYLHIDTIGHQTVLAAIAIACAACFYYVFRHRQPYSNGAVKNESPVFDYIALLGCLLFGTFVGYIQFRYRVFGSHVWLATLLPALVFLCCAYLFDHKGLLALGITGFAGAAGLSVAPAQLLYKNDFSDLKILITALVLGAALVIAARYSNRKRVKAHFSFSYHNFAANILFMACLAGLFVHPFKVFSFLLLAGLCVYFIRYAIGQRSFLFLLLATVYGYIGLTYVVFSALASDRMGEAIVTLGTMYVLGSCVGVLLFFINYKKILRLR